MKRLLLVVGLVAACSSGGLSDSDQASRCTAFADAVSGAKLSSTPTEDVAKQVAERLDELLPRMSTPELHGPAIEVHQDLHRIEQFQRRGDRERADRQAASAREHLGQLASACDLPLDRFLGR
jgi:hypothetical protein